jgi:hypothetical protein
MSFRRTNEATLKFCASNSVDVALQTSMKDFFQYRHDALHNSIEKEDFDLLSNSLRLEFVSTACVDALLKILPLFVPSTVFQDVSCCLWYCNVFQLIGAFSQDVRQGFIFSLCRIAEFYIAVPGEVIYESIDRSTLQQFDIFVMRRFDLFIFTCRINIC